MELKGTDAGYITCSSIVALFGHISGRPCARTSRQGRIAQFDDDASDIIVTTLVQSMVDDFAGQLFLRKSGVRFAEVDQIMRGQRVNRTIRDKHDPLTQSLTINLSNLWYACHNMTLL